jgi:hypothetical protein
VTDRYSHLVRVHPSLPSGRAVVHAFEGALMTVGSAPTCGVVAEVAGIADVHVRLERLRNQDTILVKPLADDAVTKVHGHDVPPSGADLPPSALLQIGEAVYVHRLLSDEEAGEASLPPLPGPLTTRHGPLVASLQRVQNLAGDGGPIWLCGPPGCGRSVVVEHMRALAGETSTGSWIVPISLDFRVSDEVPEDADPERTIAIPRLADRLEDLPVLIKSMCKERPPKLMPDLFASLLLYDWPGNVRELRIQLERAQHPRYGAMPGAAWTLRDFPDVQEFVAARPPPSRPGGTPFMPPAERHDGDVPDHMDGRTLRTHLHERRWRLADSAAELGMNRATLCKTIARFGLRGPADLLPRDWMKT